MRFSISILAAVVASLSLVSAQADSDITNDVKVLTVFPDNPFSIIKNGQANRVVLSLTKPKDADRVLTLEGITGAYLNPIKADGQKGRVLRNMTVTPYKSLPLRGPLQAPLQVPFDLFPEFKPQDLLVEIRAIISDGQTGKKHNHLAYRGTVKVIEPEKNYFDLSLLSVYLIVILFAIGTIYIALQAFNKPSETKISTSQPKKQERSRPTPTPVKGESSSKSFDESWIPEEHLRNRKARTGAGAASSGDEEGNLSSGGGKRRNRK